MDVTAGVTDPVLPQACPRSGLPLPAAPFPIVLMIILFVLGVPRFDVDTRSNEGRQVGALKPVVGDGWLLVFLALLELDLHEILAASAAQRRGPDRGGTGGTFLRTVPDQRPAVRVHAQTHVVDSLVEGVKLRSQDGRIVPVPDAAENQVALDDQPPALIGQVTRFRESLARLGDQLRDRVGIACTGFLEEMHEAIGCEGRRDPLGD